MRATTSLTPCSSWSFKACLSQVFGFQQRRGADKKFQITKKLLKDGFEDIVSQENRQSHLMQAPPRAQVVTHPVYTEEVNQTMTMSNRQIQKRPQTNQ